MTGEILTPKNNKKTGVHHCIPVELVRLYKIKGALKIYVAPFILLFLYVL